MHLYVVFKQNPVISEYIADDSIQNYNIEYIK